MIIISEQVKLQVCAWRHFEKDFPLGKVDKDDTGNEMKLDNETYIISTLIDIPEFKLYD